MLYSPELSHLGIPSWSWTDIITTIGFKEQQLNNFTTSTPIPLYHNGLLDRYNKSCKDKNETCKAIWGQSFLGSLVRLETIQYIAQDIDIQKPSDLTNRIDKITHYLSDRNYPYLFAQYIWPSSKNNTTNTGDNKITRDNTINIGEQGIWYSCDMDKIRKISTLDYKSFIQAVEYKNPNYRYPCDNGDLAHALAFNYYYYLHDTAKASLYYMIASFHDNTPLITLSMPAIILWREGNHKTSSFLRYDRLHTAYKQLKDNKNSDEQDNIQTTIDKSLKEMVSEYSLHIIDQAMLLAEKDSLPPSCLHSLSCLQTKKYITHIINTITQNCSSDKISCEIMDLGKEYGRISSSWILIYPSDDTMIYSWDEEKSQWWIAKK